MKMIITKTSMAEFEVPEMPKFRAPTPIVEVVEAIEDLSPTESQLEENSDFEDFSISLMFEEVEEYWRFKPPAHIHL